MRVLVIDASVAAKWFIDEEFGVAALGVLSNGNQLHAPDFLRLEMDSIIAKWVRRKSVSPEEGREIRDAFGQYPIRLHPFAAGLDAAFEIATQSGQSVYDSLYVALAAVLKGKMITADRKLYDALKNGPFKKNILWIEDAA